MGLLTINSFTKKIGTNTAVVVADAKKSRAFKTRAGDGRGAPASAAPRPRAAHEASARSQSQSRPLSNSATAKTTNPWDTKKNRSLPKPKIKKKPGLLFKTGNRNRDLPAEETSIHRASTLNARANASDDDGDDNDDDDLTNVVTSDDDGDNLDVQSPGSPTPEQHVPDAISMLEQLGDSPSRDELANVAAVFTNECINECLFADDGHQVQGGTAGILDRSKWESIPQFSRSDLMVRRHLGKGSFSDAFEVSVTVAVNEKKLDLSDKDDLDQRIKAKFASAEIREEGGDDFDSDATIDPTFSDGPTSAAEGSVDFQPGDDEEDLDAQINATFAAAPALPSTTQAGRPGRVRRHTVDHGVSTSFCVSKLQARESSVRMVRKKQVIYAMKCLRPQVRSNPDQFIVGIEDLVHETAVLASLDHPNVIKLHGRAASDSFRLSEGYFILLDRLVETLEDRMGYWKTLRLAAGGNSSNRESMVGRRVAPRSAPPSLPQLQAVTSVADALAYLHSRGVAFRDLKPANVGYDARGALKLFDFGFAALVDGDGDGALRDACGTPRYMAPEVGLDKPYGTPADVHSFGIFLWEVLALRKPFGGISSSEKLRAAVFEGGLRPKPARGWPRRLREVMASCWAVKPAKRPTMEVVAGVLGAHLREAASPLPRGEGGNSGLLRRSLRRLSG